MVYLANTFIRKKRGNAIRNTITTFAPLYGDPPCILRHLLCFISQTQLPSENAKTKGDVSFLQQNFYDCSIFCNNYSCLLCFWVRADDWFLLSTLTLHCNIIPMLAKAAFDELRVLHFKNFAYELRSNDIECLLKRLGATNCQIYLSCNPATNVSYRLLIAV